MDSICCFSSIHPVGCLNSLVEYFFGRIFSMWLDFHFRRTLLMALIMLMLIIKYAAMNSGANINA